MQRDKLKKLRLSTSFFLSIHFFVTNIIVIISTNTQSAGERERAAAEAAEAAEAEEYRLRDEQQRQRARERSEKQRQREQQRRNELEQQEALFSRLGNRGEAETNKLRARLREEGRDISVVPSDGNCLFSALSRALDEKGISVVLKTQFHFFLFCFFSHLFFYFFSHSFSLYFYQYISVYNEREQ